MSVKKTVKRAVKQTLYAVPVVRDYTFGAVLYQKYRRDRQACSLSDFLKSYASQFHLERVRQSKASQIVSLLRKIDICPVENSTFFYSIDCMKSAAAKNPVFGNCTAAYDTVVHHSLKEISSALADDKDAFGLEEQKVVDALREYLERCRCTPEVSSQYERQLTAAATLFQRPAKTLFEGLQRILFLNQFLWQTGHTLNGLGHLDWILIDLYQHDIASGRLTRNSAAEMLKDFFRVLHANYWFKSQVLLGDTGQIVILGGRLANGGYACNDLTYLFIKVTKQLCLPDPKILLRCTSDMPQELLEAALDCISTGLGAPLLSNDDVVIPAMLSCGFEKADVYDYGTAACWEPLIPGNGFDANNVASLNYAVPLVQMMDSEEFSGLNSLETVLTLYEKFLRRYVKELVAPLQGRVFETDPLLSLVSPSCLKNRKDITRGGAQYNNLGLTSVGMGAAVNSFLNMDRMVFREKRYTLTQLNTYRKENFAGREKLIQELKALSPAYGSDDPNVVRLAKRILSVTSDELKKYQTRLGGCFKVGLSSPAYLSGAKTVRATLDGRKNGEPLGVHISSAAALPATELISFAMKLDYQDNRLNGNVVDFFVSPGLIRQNLGKFTGLLRAGFAGGIFQLQMNVVDSKTLIAAKEDPTLFPNLVVRVWGFSAYFNDLPEEYKNVLIARAIESEKAA